MESGYFRQFFSSVLWDIAQQVEAAGEHLSYLGLGVGNRYDLDATDRRPATRPIVTQLSLPGDPKDTQSRYIEAAVNGLVIASIYTPNGNPQPGPKFDYKLAWLERLTAHAGKLRRSKAPVILAGDYNVVPTEFDIYPTKSWSKDALVQPESRAAFRKLVGRTWTDAIRTLYPNDPMYTFWDYKRLRWQRDAGLRLDHFLLSPDLAERLNDGGVDKEVRGLEGASDHAPAWITLKSLRSGHAGII